MEASYYLSSFVDGMESLMGSSHVMIESWLRYYQQIISVKHEFSLLYRLTISTLLPEDQREYTVQVQHVVVFAWKLWSVSNILYVGTFD